MPLLSQIPANVPGKIIREGLNTWDPPTHIGDPDGVPSSPGYDLVFGLCGHLGSEPAQGNLSLSLSLTLCHFVFQK